MHGAVFKLNWTATQPKLPSCDLHQTMHLPPCRQGRRDATIASVCAASWSAVAWKLARGSSGDALLAVVSAAPPAATRTPHPACSSLLIEQPTSCGMMQGAAVSCLWPVALAGAAPRAYAAWREWLVPLHLAVQHWVGLRFSLIAEEQVCVGGSGVGWGGGGGWELSACSHMVATTAPTHQPPCPVHHAGLPPSAQAAPGASWDYTTLPVFLAAFCQPWLYLVGGVGVELGGWQCP